MLHCLCLFTWRQPGAGGPNASSPWELPHEASGTPLALSQERFHPEGRRWAAATRWPPVENLEIRGTYIPSPAPLNPLCHRYSYIYSLLTEWGPLEELHSTADNDSTISLIKCDCLEINKQLLKRSSTGFYCLILGSPWDSTHAGTLQRPGSAPPLLGLPPELPAAPEDSVVDSSPPSERETHPINILTHDG